MSATSSSRPGSRASTREARRADPVDPPGPSDSVPRHTEAHAPAAGSCPTRRALVGRSCRSRRSADASEPAVAPEPPVEDEAADGYEADDDRVAEPPVQLGHVVE